MKAYELYAIWTQFEAMMENPTLSEESKLQMGGEWIRSLPPELLCASATLSHRIVSEAMRGRLNDLKNGTRTETPKEASDTRRQVQEERSDVRQKPIRKTKQNA